MTILKRSLVTCVLGLALAGPVHAAFQLTATFRDPTGTVSPTDTIDVWLTLTNTGSEDFAFDASSSTAPFGLNLSHLPDEGFGGTPFRQLPFDRYDSINLFISRSCGNASNTFDTGCFPAAGPYEYAVTSPFPSSMWFNQSTFRLGVGESIDVLTYTLKPLSGPVPAGTYIARDVGVGLFVRGRAADGTFLEADVFRASTCSDGNEPGCLFTRTVTAIPEPGTWVMMAVGVAALTLRRNLFAAR